jgi:hypothetical protein
MSLGAMRRFGPREVLDIETAAMALMNGKYDVDSDGMMGVGSMGGVITASGAVHGMAGDDGNGCVNNYRPNDGEGGGTAWWPPSSMRFLTHGPFGSSACSP